jgi:hypothetical protein
VPVDRGICCHVGGQIDFDPAGNLYLSTGDDTNPFQSDGYAPLDDRAGRNPGVRLAPQRGQHERPARQAAAHPGEAAAAGTRSRGATCSRPGRRRRAPRSTRWACANPFRFDVDATNGKVYLADYSPDAQAADPERGPAGQGRWMVIDRPANYGWPFCVTPTQPYRDYDFATETSGPAFNCAAPVNDSAHNTGRRVLPPVKAAQVVYGYGSTAAFPELGTGGIGPMGGPAYDYSARNPSRVKWPAYYDGKPLFYEWTRDYIKDFTLNRRNDVVAINDVAPGLVFDNPMDMEFGRTARSTSSSTGRGTSPSCPRRSSRGSTSPAATGRRSRWRRRRARPTASRR